MGSVLSLPCSLTFSANRAIYGGIRGESRGGGSLGGDGTAPFYLPLGKTGEIFIGWLDFGDGSGQNVTGEILHARPATPLAETLDVGSP